MQNSFNKNDIYTSIIDGYDSNGNGVAHINGKAVFVKGAIVGEECEIRIVKSGSSASYGKIERIITASAERISPDCSVFGKCGGCNLLHMSYDEEKRFKLQKVNDALSRIGKQTVLAETIIGSDLIQGYRNKCIFNFSEIDGVPCFGFFRERSHDVIPCEDCIAEKPEFINAARSLVDFMIANRIHAYDEKTGKGTVRHLFCRKSLHTDDFTLCITSFSGFGSLTDKMVTHLLYTCPGVTGIVLNINKSPNNTVLSGDFYTLFGFPDIHDTLCGNTFSISPRAFFQINPPQAERLYNKAMDYTFSGKAETVFDLYCGAGTITLCLARRAEKVIGAEIVPDAVDNAKQNAANNSVTNAEFICADVEEAAKWLAERNEHPDVIVVDPPRKGMSAEAISVCIYVYLRRHGEY